MKENSRHSSFFQRLPDFLLAAKSEGFTIAPNQWSEIYTVLETLDNPLDSKYYLASLLAKSPEQQQAFFALFETWFIAIGREEVTTDFSQLANKTTKKKEIKQNQQTPSLSESNKETIWEWWKWLLVAATILLITIPFCMWIGLSHWLSWLILGIVGLFLVYATWRYYLTRNRKIAVRQEKLDTNSNTYWDFRLPPYQLIQFGDTFRLLARRMQRRVEGRNQKLDVPSTVKASVKAGGLLQAKYKLNTQPPAYIFLIDQSSKNNHRANLFDAWYQWLVNRDIFIKRYYYRSDPRFLWTDTRQSTTTLEQLTEQYANARLFLLGDAWRLLNPATGNAYDWAAPLLEWTAHFVITPIPASLWTWREQQLQSLFTVVPFNEEGLRVVAKQLNSEEAAVTPTTLPTLSLKEQIHLEETSLPHSIATYLPNPYMQKWLAALAFFPQLNWNLTIFLGKLIANKYQQNDLLSFENLRQLTRIYWFYNGFIPEEARAKLYSLLPESEAEAIHGEIATFLEKQLIQKEQYLSTESNQLDLQILLHKAAAGIASKAELKELKQKVKAEEQDFLIARYTKEPKPWEWILPEGFDFLIPEKSESMNTIYQFMVNFTLPNFLPFEFLERKKVIEKQEELKEENVTLEENNIDSTSGLDTKESSTKKVFISYSQKDKYAKKTLENLLSPLVDSKRIDIWSDDQIVFGEQWEPIIEKAVNESNILIILLSPQSSASNWVEKELKSFLLKNNTTIIPILLSPINLNNFPQIQRFQILPTNGKAIDEWADEEEAWMQVLQEIEQSLGIATEKEIPIEPLSLDELQKLLKSYVAEGDLEKTLEYLSSIVEYSTFGDIVLIKGRYRNLKREQRLGLITEEQRATTLATINYVLLEKIEELTEKDIQPKYLKTPAPKPTPTTAPVPTPSPTPTNINLPIPDLIFVQGGSFNMGSDDSEREKPIHQVQLNDFQIGKYPITVEQYLAFVNATNSNHPEWMEEGSTYNVKTGTDDHYKKIGEALTNPSCPIVGISWYNAIAYCNWLSQQQSLEAVYKIDGKKISIKKNANGFRLPSEAEWEYAARGGRESKGYSYSGSNDIEEVAWYSDNANRKTQKIGQKKPNELGIYDMSGNVWEWCQDWYKEDYYKESPTDNPSGPMEGKYRVLRGGSWVDYDYDCRVSYRFRNSPVNRYNYYGFRISQGYYPLPS